MPDAPHKSDPCPITLTQLLVVVAIVGILAGLLLPALSASKEKVRKVSCLSNMKQIGLACAMYADVNQNRCPIDSSIPSLAGSFQLLSNLVASARVFHCPQDSRFNPGDSFANLTASNISYSYVPNLIWYSSRSNDVVIALDRIYETAKGSLWPKDGNHQDKGGYVLFDDGHCAFLTKLPRDLVDKDGKETVLSPPR